MHDGDLDERRADREHEVEVVVTLHEEAAPIREMCDDPNCDLDVERDCKHQLADVEDLQVRRADIYLARRLQNKLSESESDPTPPDVFV